MPRRALLLSLLCVAACAKKMGPRDAAAPEAAATAAPGGDAGLDYAGESEEGGRDYLAEEPTFDELAARFDQLDADLSAQGISTTAGTEEAPMSTSVAPDAAGAPVVKKKKDGQSRCERICGLKEAICDVSDRICGLAETHADEEKYTDACARSQGRCEQAADACSSCT